MTFITCPRTSTCTAHQFKASITCDIDCRSILLKDVSQIAPSQRPFISLPRSSLSRSEPCML